VLEQRIMEAISRRDFLYATLGASAGRTHAAEPGKTGTVHEQILAVADRLQKDRRARFVAVQTKEQLAALQNSLRDKFLKLLDGLPAAPGKLAVRMGDPIEATTTSSTS
jgi:hypothetical protein